jgi:hypothetical protein
VVRAAEKSLNSAWVGCVEACFCEAWVVAADVGFEAEAAAGVPQAVTFALGAPHGDAVVSSTWTPAGDIGGGTGGVGA